ncbi:MAG: hypothetical protein AB1566_07025 [Chloroflexota bacterium]
MEEPEVQAKETEEKFKCEDCPIAILMRKHAELRSMFTGKIPAEFFQHTRAARKEMLLAMRSLIDAALEKLEQEPVPKKKRVSKIPVQ